MIVLQCHSVVDEKIEGNDAQKRSRSCATINATSALRDIFHKIGHPESVALPESCMHVILKIYNL